MGQLKYRIIKSIKFMNYYINLILKVDLLISVRHNWFI